MITPRVTLAADDVARHYDELDYFYREVWGEHMHHGLWEDGHDRSGVESATVRLLEHAAAALDLTPGDRLADIGCGYGASSRWLAESADVHVLALTLSERQAAHARRAPPPKRGTVDYHAEDWLENSLPDGSLDAALAIESLAHMPDKPRFFRQLHRTLKPGGRAAVACWTTADDPTPFERRLLEKICEEGRLPGMGTLSEYHRLAQEAGLRVTCTEELTHRVERTWWIIARRVLAGLFTNPRYLRFVLRRCFRERVFLLTLPRLLLAYRTGALRYGLLSLRKASS